MSATVTWTMKDSGRLRIMVLNADDAAAIKSNFDRYPFNVVDVPPIASCTTCADATSGYVAILGESTNDQLFVMWDSVRLGRKLLVDPERKFFTYYAAFFLALHVAQEQAPIGKERVATFRRHRTSDLGELLYRPCPCGGPADFDDWSRSLTLNSNDCYNFAAKDLWVTQEVGGAMGAYGSGDLEDWKAALAPDGLTWVPDLSTTPPGATAKGWYVALALKPAGFVFNFHFLRLDGNHWVHKWSSSVPQVCDMGGALIPKDGVRAADLCGYCVVDGFFWAEPPVHAH